MGEDRFMSQYETFYRDLICKWTSIELLKGIELISSFSQGN